MTKRAVLYARKSTRQDRTEEQSASVADQLKIGRAYAEARGWLVVAEHSDDGRSGLLDRTKRPGLDAALRMVEAGEVDILVTLWTSRLSRDPGQWFTYLDVLDANGIEWHATADGGHIDRSTAMGRFFSNMQGMMAGYYSDLVGENWRRVHQRRLDAGLPKTSSPRFGYDLTDGRYVVNEAEAEAVRQAYRRYARGEGFTQVVRWLNREGWRVKGTGSEWSVRTLTRLLDSGFAAGFISREADLRDSFRGSHEALISEAEWLAYRAQRERQAKLGKKASGSGERWWLAGFVKCGDCGGSTYVSTYAGPKSEVRCSTHRANRDACAGQSILRPLVENAVGAWLLPHLDALDALAEAATGSSSARAAEAFQTAVQARDRVRDGLADLEVRRSLGEVDPSAYPIAKAKLTERLAAAEATVATAAAALQAPEADTALLRRDGWDADQRAALRGVLDRVEVGRDALTIVPVTGEPVVRSRKELQPRCEVMGCDLRHATKGLCKSHSMKARNLGVLDALAERIAQAREDASLTVTLDEVERVLTRAAELSRG